MNYLEKHKTQRMKRVAEEDGYRITRERERLARLKAPQEAPVEEALAWPKGLDMNRSRRRQTTKP